MNRRNHSRDRRWLLAALAAASAAACAPVNAVVERIFPGSAVRMARSVTIHRDEWGVPHIYGPTDASVVFGLAYAQAEDDFRNLEQAFIEALGRRAELDGEAALAADLVRAAFEVERLARDEYEREPPERRRLWNAFAAGLNHYLLTNPLVRPRLLTRFEPWFVFARARAVTAGMTIDGVRLGGAAPRPLDSTNAAGFQEVGVRDTAAARSAGSTTPPASVAWAIAPPRSATGHALLLQSANGPLSGTERPYEAHIHSDEGWHFSGVTALGMPVPQEGHNEHLGWSHAAGSADVADVYEVAFDAADALAYAHGSEQRRALAWEDTLLVRGAAGLERQRFRFRRTHQGPVIAGTDGRALAVRIARMEEGGSLQQWYAMSRATDLDEFRAALAGRGLAIGALYADVEGHILYVHGGAVPKRARAFDWDRPVDGSDPRTDWAGYHELGELPQVLDPRGGWIGVASALPLLAGADQAALRSDEYPAYMQLAADGAGDARARHARALLAADSSWTLEESERAAFDTHVATADEHIPAIIDEWERLGAQDPERALLLDSAVHELRAWDRIGTVESVATTLFVLWLEQMRGPGADTAAFARAGALERVLARLKQDWSAQRVPWGDINRLQRPHPGGEGGFDDDRLSLPVAGAPAGAGVLFDFRAPPEPDGKRRYGTSGQTWISAVELAPRAHARSIAVYGQSADPASTHFFDQAPLYAERRLREAWFWREDVERQATRTYRPGVPDARPESTP